MSLQTGKNSQLHKSLRQGLLSQHYNTLNGVHVFIMQCHTKQGVIIKKSSLWQSQSSFGEHPQRYSEHFIATFHCSCKPGTTEKVEFPASGNVH